MSTTIKRSRQDTWEVESAEFTRLVWHRKNHAVLLPLQAIIDAQLTKQILHVWVCTNCIQNNHSITVIKSMLNEILHLMMNIIRLQHSSSSEYGYQIQQETIETKVTWCIHGTYKICAIQSHTSPHLCPSMLQSADWSLLFIRKPPVSEQLIKN